MLYWQRKGKGPDVVLLHGFLGSSKIFEPLVEHLEKHFSVTTVDLPGFAGSFNVPVPPTVQELSQLVIETIQSSDLNTYSVLGHSLGAWIALEISLQQPAILQKMILYGGSPDGFCPERFESYEKSIERIRLQGVESFAADLAAEWFQLGKQDPMYPLVKQAGSHSNEEAAIQHVKSWNHWKTRHQLNQINTQTLIICGDSDRSTHPDLSIEMWKSIQESQLCIIPNAGHAAHLEQIQVFNEIVENFLS